MKRRQEDWFGTHELYLGVDVGNPSTGLSGSTRRARSGSAGGWRTVWTMSKRCSRRQATPPWPSWTRRTASAPEL